MREPVKTGWVLVHDHTVGRQTKTYRNTRKLRKVFYENKSPFLGVIGESPEFHHALTIMEKIVPRGIDARSAAKELEIDKSFRKLLYALPNLIYGRGMELYIPEGNFLEYVDKTVKESGEMLGKANLAKEVAELKNTVVEKAVEISKKWKIKEHVNTPLFSMVFTHKDDVLISTPREVEKFNEAVKKHFDGKRVVFFAGGVRSRCVRAAAKEMQLLNPDIIPIVVSDATVGIIPNRALTDVKTKDIDSHEKLRKKVGEILSAA